MATLFILKAAKGAMRKGAMRKSVARKDATRKIAPRWAKVGVIGFSLLCQLLLMSSSAAQSIGDAEETFAYIKSTLDTFNGSGRLVKNPGIDGADLEAFIDVLSEFDLAFRKEFSNDSPMCKFYLDPNNARLTIAERAEIAFSTLSSLDSRRAKFKSIAQEFADKIQIEFGSIVFGNIEKLEETTVSYLRLPSSSFDEAAQISFIDAACT
jgi:hypothetical protein